MAAHFFTKYYPILCFCLFLSTYSEGAESASSGGLAAASKAASPVDSFLQKADLFFAEGKLLVPEEDNAYIRYRAAKMLDPTNVEAQAGLDAILVHEIAAVKDLLAKSRFSRADRQVMELERLFPSEGKISELKKAVLSAREAWQRRQREYTSKPKAQPKQVKNKDDTIIYLDEPSVAKRDPALIPDLQLIARRVVRTKEGVLIYARSDAQGRWIYQQMRKASPEYRIRGDIRIGRPSVKLLAPYDD